MQYIKNELLCYIDHFISIGCEFSHINYITFSSIYDLCNITYEYYFNNPMHMVERLLDMIIARNPQLINSLDRNKNHLLIRKCSHIPFIN